MLALHEGDHCISKDRAGKGMHDAANMLHKPSVTCILWL